MHQVGVFIYWYMMHGTIKLKFIQHLQYYVSFVLCDLSLIAIPIFIAFTFPIIFPTESCHNLVYNVIIFTDSAEVRCFANLWTWTKRWLVKTSRQYTPAYQGTAAGIGELTRRISRHGQDTEWVQTGNSHHIIFSSMFLFIQLSSIHLNGKWLVLRHNICLHMKSDLMY